MSPEARFWRNVALIAIAHAALLLAMLHWSGGARIASAETITWLSGDPDEPGQTADAVPSRAIAAETPEVASQPHTESAQEVSRNIPPPSASEKSDIQIQSKAPAVTPTPTAQPKAIAKAKKTSGKAHKRVALASKEPKIPAKRISKSPAVASSSFTGRKRMATANKSGRAGQKGTSNSAAGTSGDEAQNSWYAEMLHDRFYREWIQPTTVVPSGTQLSALAKIRIEKDGRISEFEIVRSSGNIVVDESVQSVAKRISRVDALPTALASYGHYDVHINFELNPKQ